MEIIIIIDAWEGALSRTLHTPWLINISSQVFIVFTVRLFSMQRCNALGKVLGINHSSVVSGGAQGLCRAAGHQSLSLLACLSITSIASRSLGTARPRLDTPSEKCQNCPLHTLLSTRTLRGLSLGSVGFSK